ncbi:MAG: T9SS type A sorting domain-containing protein [Bacteroidetes bacterium]|nr:T9SS type A sorting domain-containing protein [Bacteroidota bacterium]
MLRKIFIAAFVFIFCSADLFSQAGEEFSSADADPLDGISYYRLREIDVDGKETFSQLVAVNVTDENALAIENIFSGDGITYLTVDCNCKNGFVTEIMDMTGKKIYLHTTGQAASQTEIRINSENFAQGIYLVKVSNGYKTRTRKFVIHN